MKFVSFQYHSKKTTQFTKFKKKNMIFWYLKYLIKNLQFQLFRLNIICQLENYV